MNVKLAQMPVFFIYIKNISTIEEMASSFDIDCPFLH